METNDVHYDYVLCDNCSAWVLEEQMWPYVEFKNKYTQSQRVPRGFKEAVEATDEAVKTQPQVIYQPRVWVWPVHSLSLLLFHI